MICEVALITIACVLFVCMGLSDAIQSAVGIRIPVVSCPKCLTFWSVLLWCVWREASPAVCVATSFICAYSALWLSLVHDALSVLYNKLYELLSETSDAEAADPATDDEADDSDEVSQM